jgi:hypothetical protein
VYVIIVMLNSFQHLMMPMLYETMKQVQGDRKSGLRTDSILKTGALDEKAIAANDCTITMCSMDFNSAG